MKQIITIFLILLTFSCKAQIIPLDSNQGFKPNSGFYYKDTNNNFNPFIGEWKWEDAINNSSLVLILNKLENLESDENFTYDLLIGEYQYIENGNELANTLLNIDNTEIIGEYHKISGHEITTKYSRPICNECGENEKRVRLIIQHDNFDGVYGWILLRHFIENGVEKLKVIVKDGAWLSSNPDAPEDIDIPFGEYIMIKQN